MGHGETKIGGKLHRVLGTGAGTSPEIRAFRGFGGGRWKVENQRDRVGNFRRDFE